MTTSRFVSKLQRKHQPAIVQTRLTKKIMKAALQLLDLYSYKNGSVRVYANDPLDSAVVAWAVLHGALREYGIIESLAGVVVVPTPTPTPTPSGGGGGTPTPTPTPTPTAVLEDYAMVSWGRLVKGTIDYADRALDFPKIGMADFEIYLKQKTLAQAIEIMENYRTTTSNMVVFALVRMRDYRVFAWSDGRALASSLQRAGECFVSLANGGGFFVPQYLALDSGFLSLLTSVVYDTANAVPASIVWTVENNNNVAFVTQVIDGLHHFAIVNAQTGVVTPDVTAQPEAYYSSYAAANAAIMAINGGVLDGYTVAVRRVSWFNFEYPLHDDYAIVSNGHMYLGDVDSEDMSVDAVGKFESVNLLTGVDLAYAMSVFVQYAANNTNALGDDCLVRLSDLRRIRWMRSGDLKASLQQAGTGLQGIAPYFAGVAGDVVVRRVGSVGVGFIYDFNQAIGQGYSANYVDDLLSQYEWMHSGGAVAAMWNVKKVSELTSTNRMSAVNAADEVVSYSRFLTSQVI
jgi:hypothetical protein